MPITRARLKISDYNENRKSRVRSNERRIRQVSLSLTSMVDMFAILVIFLLTNTSTVAQWVEVGHQIDLPKARASEPPPKAATLQISREAVFGDKTTLVSLAQVNQGPTIIEPIRSWLSRQPGKKDGYVNIVAHRSVPFDAIKKVVATCQEAGFGNVNLAVQPKI